MAELEPNGFEDEQPKRFAREHTAIETLHRALAAGRIVTWEWNIVTDVVLWSHYLESASGLASGVFDRMCQAYLAYVHPEDRGALEEAVRRSRTTGVDLDVEHRVKGPDGAVRWIRCRGKVPREARGRPVHMAGVCADVTERKRVEERLYSLGCCDPRTELPDGASLMDSLKNTLVRERDVLIAALVLDLDTLKDVDGAIGHHVGDELLVAVSKRLKACLGEGDRVGRLGRGSLVIVPVGVTTRDDAIHLAERIASQMKSPLRVGGFEVFPAFHVGIAIRHPNRADPSDRLRETDVFYMTHEVNVGRGLGRGY